MTRRPGSGPWQAARLVAISLSLLAHGAVAAWIFSAPAPPAESRSDFQIEVTTVPLVDEPIESQQATPPEIPPSREQSEVPAASSETVPQAAPGSQDQVVESKAPPATSDSGPTETVHSIPPSEQLSASRNLSEAPAATPEPPLVSESDTPLEAPRSPAPPEGTTKSEAGRPETPRKKAAPPPEEKTRGRAKEREKATGGDSSAPHRDSRPALSAPGKADARAQASYMAGVASRLLARRYFPTGAPSGSVVVNFSIAPSGKLTSRKIARSSGSSILDKAALQIVERAAPFPPFPKGVTAPRLNFSVPMNFNRK